MSWFDAVALALDYAATCRAMAKGKGRTEELMAEVQAYTLEEFARVLEKNAQTEKTPPHGTFVPADAKPTGEP